MSNPSNYDYYSPYSDLAYSYTGVGGGSLAGNWLIAGQVLPNPPPSFPWQHSPLNPPPIQPGVTWYEDVSNPDGTSFGNGELGVAQIITSSSASINNIPIPTSEPGLDNEYPYWSYAEPLENQDMPGRSILPLEFQVSDMASFEDYLMYLPPACGSYGVNCVPIGRLFWSANESRNSPNVVGGSVTKTTTGFTPWSEWPSWTSVVGSY